MRPSLHALAAAVATVSVAAGLAASGAPAGAGSTSAPVRREYAVGLRGDVLTDTTRVTPEVAKIGVAAAPERRIPVTVFYPARGAASSSPVTDARPAAGRFPVIVWAHGNGASGSATPPQVWSWAKLGYVVVAPDFPVSSHARSNLDAVADWPDQPGDVSFVLDETLDPDGVAGLRRHVDRRHVGVAGHSLGAITALAEGFSAHPDPRVDAVVSFSGLPVVDGTDVSTRPLPLLLLHGDDDTTIPVDASRAMFAAGTGPRALVVVHGGGHSPYLYAPDPDLAKALFTATSRFWDAALRDGGDPTAGLGATAIPGRTTVETAGARTGTRAAATTKTKPATRGARPLGRRPDRCVDRDDPTYLDAHDLSPADLACVAPLDTEGFDAFLSGCLGPASTTPTTRAAPPRA